jgi:hypothetical protein
MSAVKATVDKHYDLNEVYNRVGDKNVWVEFTGLARDYNAVNLGQGFPDYDSVGYINEKVNETLKDSTSLIHQYTRSPVYEKKKRNKGRL